MALGRLVGGVIAASTMLCTAGCVGPLSGPDTERAFESVAVNRATWSVRLPEDLGGVQGAQAVGDAVVVEFAQGVAVLDRATGRKRWSQEADTDYYDVVGATAETVVVLSDNRSDGDATAAAGYDIDNGEERFRRTYGVYTGAVALTSDLLLTTECRDRVCELVATDLGSGREMWTAHHRYECCLLRLAVGPTLTGEVMTTNTYVDPLRPPDGHVVAVSSGRFEDQATTRTSFLDLRTGKPVGKPVVTPGTSLPIPVTDDVYLRWGQDSSPSCELEITGYDVRTHRKLWRYTVKEDWTAGGPTTCVPGRWRPRLAGDAFLTRDSDERPALFDLSTGKPTWTGTAGMHPIGADNGIVVTTGPGSHAATVDVETSKRLWNDPDEEDGTNTGDHSVASGRYVHTYFDTAPFRAKLWTHDLRTGATKVCDGSNQLFGIGDGWLLGGLGRHAGSLSDFRYELRYFRL